MSGMTGAQAAERILHAAGIYDVRVQHVSGNLTDHYNPANKTLNLSDSVCNQTSVAAVGVAAHECGHAIQHARGYVPLRLRTAFVPIANFGSMLAWPVIILGVIINSRSSMMPVSYTHLFTTMSDSKETLIFLMGLSRVRQIVDGLMQAGRNRQTPAAVISHATTCLLYTSRCV